MNIRYLLLLVVSIGFVACRVTTDTSSDNNDKVVPLGGTRVECASESCDATSEYCLKSMTNNGKVMLEHKCVPLPIACHSCSGSCLQDDAKAEYPTSNNCSLMITCIDDNGKRTVTCYAPPI